MSELTSQAMELINDPASIKIVSTINAGGVIHTAPKGTLRVIGNQLEYVEILESSTSYKNVVYSLWFNKKVTVLAVGANRQAYQFVGTVQRILTSGREFEEAYVRLAEQRGFYIAAVVRIDVESVTDLDLAKGIDRQKKEHFFFKHLDQLAIS